MVVLYSSFMAIQHIQWQHVRQKTESFYPLVFFLAYKKKGPQNIIFVQNRVLKHCAQGMQKELGAGIVCYDFSTKFYGTGAARHH